MLFRSRFPTILNLGFQGLTFSYVATNMNLFQLPISSPLTWIFAFVLYDFLYYWMHRLHHEYKFLWATHVVHHHGEEFNLSTALRQTSSGFLWKWIFFVPILLVGIPHKCTRPVTFIVNTFYMKIPITYICCVKCGLC